MDIGSTAVTGSAMKTCPKCAEQVQDEAKVCRYCSHRFNAGVPWPVAAVGFVVILGAVWLYTGSQPTATPKQNVTATANELSSAYAGNEVAAKARFGDVAITISGEVERVTDGAVVYRTADGASVGVTLQPGNENLLASLRPGDTLSVHCTDTAYVLGVVALGGCTPTLR